MAFVLLHLWKKMKARCHPCIPNTSASLISLMHLPACTHRSDLQENSESCPLDPLPPVCKRKYTIYPIKKIHTKAILAKRSVVLHCGYLARPHCTSGSSRVKRSAPSLWRMAQVCFQPSTYRGHHDNAFSNGLLSKWAAVECAAVPHWPCRHPLGTVPLETLSVCATLSFVAPQYHVHPQMETAFL